MKKIIVAIDGWSSSGKSTMAKQLAAKIGYRYIDTGAMYRAVTLQSMREGIIDADGNIDLERLVKVLPSMQIDFNVDSATGRSRTTLNGEDVEDIIRTLEVSNFVSPIAAVPEVRHYLVARQREMGNEKSVVMDGRDIGTTVFPDAEMKVFVDASPEVRARRRYLELKEKGQNPVYEDVLRNITERDTIDSTRAESPLRKAEDAVVLNNDNMSREEQMQWLLDLFKQRADD